MDISISQDGHFQNTELKNRPISYLLQKVNNRFDFRVHVANGGSNSKIILSLISNKQVNEENFLEFFESQFKKIHLYFLICLPELIVQKHSAVRIYHVVDKISEWDGLINYLNSEFNEQENLLLLALTDLKRKDGIFDGFPKLVNWLDDNKARGISGFCYLRDGLVHGILDKKRSYKKINEQFPDEFDFDKNLVLKRNGHNHDKLIGYIPKLKMMIEDVFKEKFVNNSSQ